MRSSSGNIKMAIAAIRAARWRSTLTMLGIIIAIVSVVTIVSLGEGAKRGVVGQINDAGQDLITVKPGRAVEQSSDFGITSISFLTNPSGGAMTEADYKTVLATRGVNQVIPFSFVTTTISKEDKTFADGRVIGTATDLPEALGQKVEFGSFFDPEDYDRNVAVIGRRVAEQLFGENVPIGKVFTIRGETFFVRGIFEEFDTSPLSPDSDYNSAVFIPYDIGKKLTGGDSQIYQILVRPNSPDQTAATVKSIQDSLAGAHSNQRDFAVLTQEDNLAAAKGILNLFTAFIAAIASISLIVAGIGILNIMLVSVTERTHEIGVRKAVGATNRQIMNQFLTESVILSFMGGVFGIILALFANYLLRIFTNLTPILTWQIFVVSAGVSILVGIIFGVTPALIAARKHPIDALRHE